MEFLEVHTRSLYRLLEHGAEYTDLRCIDVNQGKVVSREIVQGEEKVIRWAKAFNGRGNCFIGRNPRDKVGTVTGVQSFSLDLDPVRPKGAASTEAQLRYTFKLSKAVAKRYATGYLAMSGNGCLILFRFNRVDANAANLESFRRFEDDIRQRFSGQQEVVIDHTHDHARLIKLLGTVSTKGDSRYHRVSRFVDFVVPPYRRADDIFKEFASRAVSKPPSILVPSLPEGSRRYASRSEADFALAAHYKKAGLSASDTLLALKSHVLGRQTDEKDQARIIEKVFGGVEIPPRQLSLGNGLQSYFTGLEQRSLQRQPEYSTGFALLDSKIWGLQRGELTTIAARSGYGKTSFAVCVTASLSRAAKRILYCSTELLASRVQDKYLAVTFSVPEFEFTSGQFSAESKTKLENYRNTHEAFPFTVCDESEPSFDQIRGLAQELQPEVIVFDHINRVGESRDRVARYVKDLKNLAKEFNIALLVLAQLNEPLRDPKTGHLFESVRSDVRESKEIINEAAVFIFLSNLPHPKGQRLIPVAVNIAKGRYGGNEEVLELQFDKLYGRFQEMSK